MSVVRTKEKGVVIDSGKDGSVSFSGFIFHRGTGFFQIEKNREVRSEHLLPLPDGLQQSTVGSDGVLAFAVEVVGGSLVGRWWVVGGSLVGTVAQSGVVTRLESQWRNDASGLCRLGPSHVADFVLQISPRKPFYTCTPTHT